MSYLAKLRKQIMTAGVSEAELLANGESAAVLWSELQELKKEMNQAKKAAADAAAVPYLELIEQVEKRYAMLVRLSAR